MSTETTLREVVERLAPLERRAGSAGEREAAEWIADRLTRAGAPARVEEVPFHPGYAPLIAALSAAGAAGGAAALTRRGRLIGAVGAAAAAALIADDVSNGPRLARRTVVPEQTTQNVIAEAGDPAASRTLVVLAHHDAAPTGAVFDQTAQRWFAETFPGIVERIDTSIPNWWPVIGAPLLTATGAVRRRRGMTAAGLGLCLVATAAFADIARSPVVPGANDNLSAVAVLVAFAEALRERPIEGLRILLVSCGAEEVLQGGIHGFAKNHLAQMDRDSTFVLNVDTVGSPRLVLLEGEGTLVMEDYVDLTFRDLVARAAELEGIRMRRGMRSRNSTDGVVPSRLGFPTATVVSIDRQKAIPNYHQLSDTPENVDYGTVAEAVTLTEATARLLGGTR